MTDCLSLIEEGNREKWNMMVDDITSKLLSEGNLLCPDTNNLETRGHFGQREFSYVEILVKACNSTITSCFSSSEIDNKKIRLISMNT